MRTVVSNKLFTASPIAIMAGMAHESIVRDRQDPEYRKHMASFKTERWVQIFRSANDGNSKNPRYTG